MGAVFAAAARAPMTAVLIIFELTGEYQVILPLMFAIALAAGVGNLLSGDTIYTLKLRRRGIDLGRAPTGGVMETLRVEDAMQSVPTPLEHDTPVATAVQRFAAEHVVALPVIDRDARYRGSVTAEEVERAVNDQAPDTPIGSLARAVPTVAATQMLEDALPTLAQSDGAGVPVLAGDGSRVIVGWLTHHDVLRAYAERHARRAVPPAVRPA
jgi:CIC family chloride channel protein